MNTAIYRGIPETWVKWLTKEEIDRLKQAARADIETAVIIAGVLYLGLDLKAAAAMTYDRAYGDAVEDRNRGAFLHIPDEYRVMIERAGAKRTGAKNTRIIHCTAADAAEKIVKAFDRAGITAAFCLQRLRRTAARLQFSHNWTDRGNIERWFEEIEQITPEQNRVLFFREKTDREIQEELDRAFMSMGALLTGRGKPE